MIDRLNHVRLADLLDRAHTATVQLDRALALAGVASWPIDSPRRHSLAALEQLAGTRETLDRITVAAGFASPYVRRDLKPDAYTRAAAREAQPWPYATSEHANLGRVHRRGVAGPSGEDCDTGDEHHPASLDEGANEFRPVPPPSIAHASPNDLHDHGCTETRNEPSEPLAAI